MELKIYSFEINENDIKASGDIRSFTITGDPGAVFSLSVTNEDSPSKYYNFTSKLFTTTNKRLKHISIPSSGVYTNIITFPSVTDNDHYTFDLWAEPHFNTKHTQADSLLLRTVLYQYVNTEITLKPDSKAWDVRFKAMPSDIDVSGPRGSNISSQDFEWEFESNPSGTDTFALKIERQPLETDFEIWQTQDVNGEITSATTSITLDSLGDLFVGMYFTGTGVDLDSDSNAPTITSIDTDTKTITASTAQSGISDGATLIFWGGGFANIKKFNDTIVKFSNLEVVMDPLTVTVDGTTTTSRNITLDDAGGIRVGTDATVKGIDFDNSTTQRPTAINYSTKVLQVTSNQSLEDGTILIIDGYGKKATLTGTITIVNVPLSDFAIQFDVDSVLTAATS